MRRLLDQMMDHLRGETQIERTRRDLDVLSERLDTTKEWYALGVTPMTIEQFKSWVDSSNVYLDSEDQTVYIGEDDETYIEIFFHGDDGAYEVVHDAFVIGRDGLVMTNAEHIEMDRHIMDRIRRTHPQFAKSN